MFSSTFAASDTTWVYLFWNPIVFYENQPGSWLVAICERSENRGSGGGGSCQTGQKSGKIGGKNGRPLVWFGRVMYQAAK